MVNVDRTPTEENARECGVTLLYGKDLMNPLEMQAFKSEDPLSSDGKSNFSGFSEKKSGLNKVVVEKDPYSNARLLALSLPFDRQT